MSVLRTSCRGFSYGHRLYACPNSSLGTQLREDVATLLWIGGISWTSTPQSIVRETSSRPSHSPGTSSRTSHSPRLHIESRKWQMLAQIFIVSEALPSDKLLLVEILKEQGQVVTFFGQRTDEASLLRAADVGIAIREWSSKRARESCDIFVPDGSFPDLIIMVDSGKCIHDNIQSFFLLVLITTISRTLISFFETVLFGDVSLATLQFVWVKLNLAVFGGFALLTKPSTDKHASLLPLSCRKSLITAEMIRNIVLQVFYQAMCSLAIELKGSALVGTDQNMKTAVSNIFIWSISSNPTHIT
ncbi:calcium-transporting ATPase 12, plasma membrane-type-like protein [Tanacetum coccineum]